MHPRKLSKTLSLTVLAGFVLMALNAAPSAMADERTAAVKARQDLMKDVGKNMKALGGFVKGGVGSAEEAAGHAKALAGLAEKISGAFEVEATLEEMDAVGKNRAKPEIWADFAGFEAAAKQMGVEAGNMAQVLESGDAGQQAMQFEKLGNNGCGGCHEKFRGPKVE